MTTPLYQVHFSPPTFKYVPTPLYGAPEYVRGKGKREEKQLSDVNLHNEKHVLPRHNLFLWTERRGFVTTKMAPTCNSYCSVSIIRFHACTYNKHAHPNYMKHDNTTSPSPMKSIGWSDYYASSLPCVDWTPGLYRWSVFCFLGYNCSCTFWYFRNTGFGLIGYPSKKILNDHA